MNKAVVDDVQKVFQGKSAEQLATLQDGIEKKLAAKGIHVEIESLRKDYDAQKAGGAADGTGIGGGNGKFDHHHFDARSVDAEIDVVGDDELGK